MMKKLLFSMAVLLFVGFVFVAMQVEQMRVEPKIDTEVEPVTQQSLVPPAEETEMLRIEITLTEDEALTEKEYSEATMQLTYPDSILQAQKELQLEENVGTVQATQTQEDSIGTTQAEQSPYQDIALALRYRGNSSYGQDKKPYKIKLDEKADLLRGIMDENAQLASEDWVLLANLADPTNMRNYYMYLVAGQLTALEYTPKGIFAEVYFQGEYQGVFLLCEEIEVEKARLDIDDTYSMDNAVLMELRPFLKQEYGFSTIYDGVVQYYDIRSEIAGAQQVVRAKEVVDAVGQAILSGEQAQVAAVMDLDSCVDMFILQEFMMNIDVGYASFYVYIKENDDKLYFGPPWDFDRSMGYLEWYDEFLASGEPQGQYHINAWNYDLIQYEWFQDLVRARWNEVKGVFLENILVVEQISAQYQEAFQKNEAVWFPVEGQTQEMREEAYNLRYIALSWWAKDRYQWLDQYFNDEM